MSSVKVVWLSRDEAPMRATRSYFEWSMEVTWNCSSKSWESVVEAILGVVEVDWFVEVALKWQDDFLRCK